MPLDAAAHVGLGDDVVGGAEIALWPKKRRVEPHPLWIEGGNSALLADASHPRPSAGLDPLGAAVAWTRLPLRLPRVLLESGHWWPRPEFGAVACPGPGDRRAKPD